MSTHAVSLELLKRSLKKNPDKIPMFDRMDSSFNRFRTAGGEEFLYSNFDNGLYSLDKKPLSKVMERTPEYDAVIEETRSFIKSNKPFWVRILLGHACNYSCDYCLQKDIGNPDEREKITTTDYMIDQLAKLDLTRLKKIDLWGGETLLYWKTIEAIMLAFDRDGLEWYIPTNGTPLMQKHIDFFSGLKSHVNIGISHDGPGHERLRGEEFLHKKVEVIRALQATPNISLGFNAVLSNTNYDIFAINKFFYDYLSSNGLETKRVGLGLHLARNYDYENQHGSALHIIHGENLDKFKVIIREFIAAAIEQSVKKIDRQILDCSLIHDGTGVLGYAKSLKTQILPTHVTSCGVDDQGVLSVDMKGNVRTCPHVDESFISGRIEDIPGVKLKNIELDRYERHCHKCPVFRLCKSSCPIEVPQDVFYSNCRIEKIYYRAIQEAAFGLLFKQEVALVE